MPETLYSRPVIPVSTPLAAGELGLAGAAPPYALQYHDGQKVVTPPFWRTVEVDFGTVAQDFKQIVISDPLVTEQSIIIAVQSGVPGSGLTADENEMDQYVVNALPGPGSITLNFTSVRGSALQGLSRINYTVG